MENNADTRSKVRNSVRNIWYSGGEYVIVQGLRLLNRYIFIRTMSQEYLGIGGLFTNILTILSLAELGVTDALNYAMYEPVKNGDIALVRSVLGLCRKYYYRIGIAVLVIGSLFMPFLPALLSDIPDDMPFFYLYYLLFVMHSGISYFFSYKRTLLFCQQRQYLISGAQTVSQIILMLVQAWALIFTKSYALYLFAVIVMNVAENLMISQIADREYPWILEKNEEPIPQEMRQQIIKNTFAMLVHKIAWVVLTATDNLLIARFVSLAAVGAYSNYTLLVGRLTDFVKRIFSGMLASVGNLVLSEEKEYVECVFQRMLFLNFWIYSFCTVGLLCLIQPFIKIFAGESYLLGTGTVLVILANFYILGMRETVLSFWSAAGVFSKDRYKPVIESMLNLGLSVWLGRKYGITGILIGTLLSVGVVAFWIEGYLVYKHLFHKRIWGYAGRQIGYLGITIFMGGVTWWMCSKVAANGVGSFLFRAVICLVLPNGMIWGMFHKTEEGKYYKSLFLKAVRKGIEKE